MELNLKLADDDSFIVKNNQYQLTSNSFAARQETQKGAIIISKGDATGNVNVSSNYALTQNGTDIIIDYTKPDPDFVDSMK